MSASSFPLDAKFNIVPAELLSASGNDARSPIDSDGFVPLRIFGQEFGRAIAAFAWLGDNAVRMTMHHRETGEELRFGFKAPLKEHAVFGELWRKESDATMPSQQVDGIILSPSDNDPRTWCATLDTAEPLTEYDKKLFSYGVLLYVEHVVPRLWAALQQPTT